MVDIYDIYIPMLNCKRTSSNSNSVQQIAFNKTRDRTYSSTHNWLSFTISHSFLHDSISILVQYIKFVLIWIGAGAAAFIAAVAATTAAVAVIVAAVFFILLVCIVRLLSHFSSANRVSANVCVLCVHKCGLCIYVYAYSVNIYIH